MDIFTRYREDFDNIVSLVWSVYTYHSPELVYDDFYLDSLKKDLIYMRDTYWSIYTIDLEDIEQQVKYLWLKYTKKFREKDKIKTSLRDYLLSCTMWGLKSWYYQEVIGMSHSLEYDVSFPNKENRLDDFRLDLSFLVDSTLSFPFDTLGLYERYLLYLMYKENKSIISIADTIQRDRSIVSRQIHSIHEELRSLVNGT